MKRLIVLGISSIILFTSGFADSLWEENFNGYIAGGKTIEAGDIVTIVIDSGFSFQFASTSKDSKSITFEFSGGEYGNLLSFLPAVQTGRNESVQGKDSYAMSAELSARVTSIDQFGKLVLAGTKVVQFEGKQESVVFSGRVDPRAVDAKGRVDFSRVEGVRLSFTSFLTPLADTITDKDIQEVVKQLEGAESTLDTGTGATGAQLRTTELSPEKKRELVLLYLNRLVDILFK
ncbi:MAG: hypothetical protein EHM28_12640 [Spirochaetaceae bacterium]|nr:MAG: hypothetical protein EHM28_12640 [Spirochaetaceae bacterium]